jgi:hypothetical protein
MCFVLYMATPRPVPLINWDEKNPSLHIEDLGESEVAVAGHFTLPHCYHAGSDTFCGCGYRNASYQNGSWPEEEWQPDDYDSDGDKQAMHEKLVSFIRAELLPTDSVEFYGLWEDDLTLPALSDQEIDLSRLTESSFFFRDRGRYRIKQVEQGADGDAEEAV